MKEQIQIDGSSGICPLGPSGRVKAAVRKAVKKINHAPVFETHALNRFFESKFSLSSEQILFAQSLTELVYLIPDVLRPERVLIVGPALDIYEDAARSAGAEVSYLVGTETDGFVPDMAGMLDDIGNSDLVCLANPNRIHGRMVPLHLIREVMQRASSGGPHVMIDESLAAFAGSEEYPHDVLGTGNVTILRTTAFFYGMPGLELAHAVSSPEIIHRYREKTRSAISLLSVEAARTAYKDSSYRKASRTFVMQEKKMIMALLSKIRWIRVYDTDTNMFLMKIDKNPDELERGLKRIGLEIRNCAEIKGLDSSYFRVSVMKHENNLKFMSVLDAFSS